MCGMTRAVQTLLMGNILQSISYNILCIPIVLFFVLYGLVVLYSLFKKTDNYLIKLERFVIKHYKLILVIFIINMIINNIRKI